MIFLAGWTKDPQFTRFFSGFGTDTVKRIRQLIVDQLCVAAGGPCYYTGRDTKKTHAGLGITEKDWEASANHLVASFEQIQCPGEREKRSARLCYQSQKRHCRKIGSAKYKGLSKPNPP